MQGEDKGLIPWRGLALAAHALQRLRPQVGAILISANRNEARYQALLQGQAEAANVLADASDHAQAGPLAGLLTALRHCHTPYLLCAACDMPLLPLDLAARLGQALQQHTLALARTADGLQPTTCLMRCEQALPALLSCLNQGVRKMQTWVEQLDHVTVPFDDATAFININTPADLEQLEQLAP